MSAKTTKTNKLKARQSLPADTLELYMREARAHSLLTPEEEKALLQKVVDSRTAWMEAFLHTEMALRAVWEDIQAWESGEVAALSLIPGPPKTKDEATGPTLMMKRLAKVFNHHVKRTPVRSFRGQKATARLVRAIIHVGFRPAPLKRYREAALSTGSDRIRRKVQKARQQFLDDRLPLIERNLRLVMKLAHNFVPGPLAYSELIQEGNIGLIRSTESFSQRFGVRFSTYAYLWIRQAILRALENKSRTIRLPVSLTQALRKLEREEAEGTGDTEDRKSRLTGALANPTVSRPILSLDHSLDDETDLAQMIADRNGPGPEGAPTSADTSSYIQSSLTVLPERQRLILRLRFGIDCPRPHTLTEIGEILGVSAERIRQLQQQAFDTLREGPAGEVLEELVLS